MVPRLTILSVLIISTTCSILPLIPISIQLVPIQPQIPRQEVHIPNYSFSYNVNDEHTGDIKHQQETRHGDTVTGQYSLIQPDGIRRTVDYRADDARGFLATVNNHGANLIRQSDDNGQDDQSQQWQPEQPRQQQQQWQPLQQQQQPQLQQWQPQQQKMQLQHQQQQNQQQYQPQQQQYQPQQQGQMQLQQYQLQQHDQNQPQNVNVSPPMSISRSSLVQSVQDVQSQSHPWA